VSWAPALGERAGMSVERRPHATAIFTG
jgi:hypothetical protein